MIIKKQPFRGVLSERCSENIQQIYKRTHFVLVKDFWKDFKNISYKCVDPLSRQTSIRNLKNIFALVFIISTRGTTMLTLSVLHIRTMNDAIRLYMLAHRHLFYFSECFTCFIFFIHLWSLLLGGGIEVNWSVFITN